VTTSIPLWVYSRMEIAGAGHWDDAYRNRAVTDVRSGVFEGLVLRIA
jgi:hypothetical protein